MEHVAPDSVYTGTGDPFVDLDQRLGGARWAFRENPYPGVEEGVQVLQASRNP
jgi:hypothetical protein